MKKNRIITVVGIALVAMLSVLFVTASSTTGGTALLSSTSVSAALASTQSYTSTQTGYTTGADTGLYGAAQIQIKVATSLSGTASTVFTPQFSNQPTSCGNPAIDWVSGTPYTLTNSTSGLYEFETLARCFRLKITSNADVYTPTVYLRFVNRH